MTSRRTAHHKKVWLDAFSRSGNVSQACRETGVGRSTVRGWKHDDPDFAMAYGDAEADGLDALVAEARRRAMGFDTVEVTTEILRDRRGNAVLDADGRPRYIETKRVAVRRFSDNLLMFLIKKLDPSYRERFSLEHSGQIGVQIDALDAAVARLVALDEVRQSPVPELASSDDDVPALPEPLSASQQSVFFR